MYQNIIKQLSPVIIPIILLSLSQVYSQVDTLWTKTFGGSNRYNAGYSVKECADEGYIICGTTNSLYDRGDILLIKTNSTGDTLWTKTFGVSEYDDQGYSVWQTSDGGYIITGRTVSFDGTIYSTNAWLIKTNSSGNLLWTKKYGSDGCGRSIQQTEDGGYIITGDTGVKNSAFHDIWLIKTNSSGDTLWTNTYGGNYYDGGESVQQTLDGGYIITGYTYSNSSDNDVLLIKTDSYGKSIWTKAFGGIREDYGHSVQQTSDGGYIVTGFLNIRGYDVWVIKTNASGDTIWTKTFGGSYRDVGYSVQQTFDGGYIVIGMTFSSGDNTDYVWLLKINSSGQLIWTKTFGGTIDDCGYSVQQTIDEGYIISGRMNGHICLIKTTPYLNAIQKNNKNIPNDFNLSQNFPNPFNPITTIEFTIPAPVFVLLKVYNIMGEEISTVISKKLYPGNHTYTFDGSGLASGIYYYQLVAGEFIEVKKMVLLK